MIGYIVNLDPIFFIFSLVLNSTYIESSFSQIWSVYLQYLPRCDHFKKYLFLVIQLAEVLLNFWLSLCTANRSSAISRKSFNDLPLLNVEENNE